VNCNRFIIDGQIAARDELRYTPAGLEKLEFKIQHQSTQQQAGMPRQVQCEISAQAFGELARQAATLSVGQAVNVAGFITQRSLRSTQLVLQIDKLTLE